MSNDIKLLIIGIIIIIILISYSIFSLTSYEKLLNKGEGDSGKASAFYLTGILSSGISLALGLIVIGGGLTLLYKSQYKLTVIIIVAIIIITLLSSSIWGIVTYKKLSESVRRGEIDEKKTIKVAVPFEIAVFSILLCIPCIIAEVILLLSIFAEGLPLIFS